ncbi:MAG: peroxiredoxin [Granulosicoccaceae bacterium]
MTIKVGDKLPQTTFYIIGENGPQPLASTKVFAGKKVVFFALPGAFTPTCSQAHVPGFVVNADDILAKGVDTIVCMSVNDPFVMKAWGEQSNAEQLLMLSDGNAEFTKAIGLDADMSVVGLGVRCGRFAMIVDDGEVKHLAIEEPQQFEVSSADAIMAVL